MDTHALLSWLFDDARLSPTARHAIADPDDEILVSSAAAWEISTRHRLGKLPEPGDVPTRLRWYLDRARFAVLPISLDHAMAAGAQPGPHKDPFDRKLISQARVEILTVVTVDPAFDRYGVPVLW